MRDLNIKPFESVESGDTNEGDNKLSFIANDSLWKNLVNYFIFNL